MDFRSMLAQMLMQRAQQSQAYQPGNDPRMMMPYQARMAYNRGNMRPQDLNNQALMGGMATQAMNAQGGPRAGASVVSGYNPNNPMAVQDYFRGPGAGQQPGMNTPPPQTAPPPSMMGGQQSMSAPPPPQFNNGGGTKTSAASPPPVGG